MHYFKMVKLPLTNGAAVKKKKWFFNIWLQQTSSKRGKVQIFRLIKVQINVYKTNSNLYFTQYDWQVFKHIL